MYFCSAFFGYSDDAPSKLFARFFVLDFSFVDFVLLLAVVILSEPNTSIKGGLQVASCFLFLASAARLPTASGLKIERMQQHKSKNKKMLKFGMATQQN